MKNEWIAAIPALTTISLFVYKFLMRVPGKSDQAPVPADLDSKKFWVYATVMFLSSIAAAIAVYLLIPR